MKKNKRTPSDELPTVGYSCYQSTIQVNFKRAHYDLPDRSDYSDVGDSTRFEDLLISNLDTFTEL